ncbi:aspartyl/glutamyl-tRNA(Asn/Gln) amidotransferase subunit B-like [Ylistrum balloti]|uniref:aspartyl/glutamyl-tRNA(Asn/Gln) amidotransferase subunit B-like n=1 Tax=Ylistrum balloti TaxID=509963 RepID=UPI002905C156|nr:aspartyl/glutamyl-tRNA(Asn/Gln) amidotransferase subunit B-like [Ylistrum balloti]
MFCSCPNNFGDTQNTNVCPVCLGFPGMLPMPNAKAIQYAYRIARALQCTLAPTVQFDRKNYFYPDLPKNYQISQFHSPIGRNGVFGFLYNNTMRSLRIHEAHLEEDAGKLIHSSESSYCDYNRSGTPLMEIVTEPELHSPEEAESMLRQFRRLVRYLAVCDGNMEEGSLRCDANVSINYPGKGLGVKVEIKNVNSFRFVRAALEYEIQRQSTVLTENKNIVQETRLWNENRDITVSMRSKEQADDYRYFPEPDISPVTLGADFFTALDEEGVELPSQRQLRLQKTYSLDHGLLDFFMEEKTAVDYLENVLSRGVDPKLVATWATGDVKKLYNKHSLHFASAPLTPERFSSLLQLIQEGKLHGKMAKIVLEKIFEEDCDPELLIEKYSLQELPEEELLGIIHAVLQQKAEAAKQYKDGNTKSFGFLMGAVMQASKGKANPSMVKKLLESQLM